MNFIRISSLTFSLTNKLLIRISLTFMSSHPSPDEFKSFQQLLHDAFFNFLLELSPDDSGLLTLDWVTSHFGSSLGELHDKFFMMFIEACRKDLVSGGTRVKLLSDYCAFNLAVRECFNLIIESVSYAEKCVRLAASIANAFIPDSEGGVEPAPLLTVSDFKNGILSLSLLKEVLFQEEGNYERALDFVGTIGLDEDENQPEEVADMSNYIPWCSRTSELLSDKLGLLANKLRQRHISGNVKLHVYSMNFVMFWCSMVASLAFVPRPNHQNYGNAFSSGRVHCVGPKVHWKDVSDELLSSIWEGLPEDLSHGSLIEIRKLAASTMGLSDLLDGVGYLSIDADLIAEIRPLAVELEDSEYLGPRLMQLHTSLNIIHDELYHCWCNAMSLLEKYN